LSVQLDHILIPVKDRQAAAKLLAFILGVPWGESSFGPFTAVYVNDGLTLDFDETDAAFPVHHYCFRVAEGDFDAILSRIESAGIAYRSSPHGPVDGRVDTAHGGKIVYWSAPGGHYWEALTVSYARQPTAAS